MLNTFSLSGSSFEQASILVMKGWVYHVAPRLSHCETHLLWRGSLPGSTGSHSKYLEVTVSTAWYPRKVDGGWVVRGDLNVFSTWMSVIWDQNRCEWQKGVSNWGLLKFWRKNVDIYFWLSFLQSGFLAVTTTLTKHPLSETCAWGSSLLAF